MLAPSVPAERNRADRLVFVAIALVLAHILAILVLRNSPLRGRVSDYLTLIIVLFGAFACFAGARRSFGLARTFWRMAGSTVALWSIGKAMVIYGFYIHGMTSIPIVPLLVLFLAAAPMFVAVFLSGERKEDASVDWEAILDTVQILVIAIFIYLFVIYIPLLVYGESVVGVQEDRLLLGRNILLSIFLLSRAILAGRTFVRRLYSPPAVIFCAFAWLTWKGNRAQAELEGLVTSFWDLAWSVPFVALGIAALTWHQTPDETFEPSQRQRLSTVVFAYTPSLILPVMLLVQRNEILREQIVLGLVGLMFSIVLFNTRLAVTQRRQRLALEALNASERQYHSLFERNMAGVYRASIDGRLIDCNPAFSNVLGYSRSELGQLPMSALYFGGVAERERKIASIRSEPHLPPHEMCLRRKDGTPVWVIENAAILKQVDGTDLIEGTVIDITERKLNSLAVEDWKRRYETAVLASGQIIYDWNPATNAMTFGGAIREILGYSAEEFPTSTLSWRELIHPDDLQQYLVSTRGAGDGLTSFDAEYRVRCKDGNYRTVREQGWSAPGGIDSGTHIVGFIADITDRRVLEAQLRQAQKLEALGRLAGGVAHDFNNLLTIISGYSAIQLTKAEPSSVGYHEAEQIKAAADRAAALTRQLLAFSRQQVLQPRRVNLNDIIRNAEKMLTRIIGEDIEVQTSFDSNLGTVKVDPGQIDQVLMNLVVNARDAMPNGGRLKISTENVDLDNSFARSHPSVVPGPHVLLSVSDNGTGMDSLTQARIFEPFFTTKEPGKGTGLGLPMVYGIVQQSGGWIEVASQPGNGTTFNIYIPRVDASVENDATDSSLALPDDTRGTERILLVEDDAQLRRLITTVLKTRGYTVEIVDGLQELDEALRRISRCHLLLTDVVMPRMSGPEVADVVSRHWTGIKVLYVSGYTTNNVLHDGVIEKQLHFLQKPFSPVALAKKVREVLDSPIARPASHSKV